MQYTSEQNKRTFPLVNGNKIVAERKEPYWLWHLSLEHGRMPPKFQGAYSTTEEVIKAVSQYVADRELEVGPEPERPQIKFKPVRA